jgi:hypothetical protein
MSDKSTPFVELSSAFAGTSAFLVASLSLAGILVELSAIFVELVVGACDLTCFRNDFLKA